MHFAEKVGLLFVAGSIAVVSAGCQAPPPAGLAEADRQALRERAAAWSRAASTQDFDALGGLYAEDAVLLPPNDQTLRGRAAIREFFAGFPPMTDVRLEQVEVDGRDDLAYVWGTYSVTMTPPGAEAPVRDRGKYLEIWRKQSDGTWRITRDAFSSDLPPPATPPPADGPAPGE